MKRAALTFVLALAVTSPAIAGTEASEATGEIVEAAVLRLHLGDRSATVTAPIGKSVEVEDVTSGVRLEIVPALDAADGEHVVVELYRAVGDERDLVESLLLPFDGAATTSRSPFPMIVELVSLGPQEVPRTPAFDPQTGGLRPLRCCITCDGLTVCAMCVEFTCGSCCIF